MKYPPERAVKYPVPGAAQKGPRRARTRGPSMFLSCEASSSPPRLKLEGSRNEEHRRAGGPAGGRERAQLGAVAKGANCVDACLTARRPARGAFSSLHRRQRPSPDSHIVDIAPAFFSGRACVDPSMNVLYKLVEARRVSPSQLQRWDQRVREGRAVAAGPGAVQRDVGGEA